MVEQKFVIPRYQILFILSLIIPAFFLINCSGNEMSIPSDSTGQPVDQGMIAAPTTSYTFAASSPGFTRIEGMLVVTDPLVVLPKPDGVYLLLVGDEIQTEGDITKLLLVDAYQADVDERDGRFVFPNVDAGRYAIVVETTGNLNIPTHISGSGELVFIEIGMSDIDKVIDIGRIRVP